MNLGDSGRAIVFGGTRNMSFAIGTAVMNWVSTQTCPSSDSLIVYHDGIPLSDQRVLAKVADVQFITYEPSFVSSRMRKMRFINYFSPMVFSKFECLSLLDTYPKVMWLDFDIHIRKDLSELLEADDTPFLTLPSGRTVGASFTRPIHTYNMEVPGMSAGTFVVSRSLGDFAAMHQFCQEQTVRYANHLKMPEQAIFDIMLQEFGIDHTFLNPETYALHPKDWHGTESTSILHCYGREKFWSGLSFRPWERNYEAWLAAGGSAASVREQPLRNAARKVRRGIRQGLRDV